MKRSKLPVKGRRLLVLGGGRFGCSGWKDFGRQDREFREEEWLGREEPVVVVEPVEKR